MVPGEVILLKYKILRIFKHAQDSCIFLVEHIDLNSYWIIKKVNIHSQKYLKEIELLKGIRHDNIPLFVDVFFEGDWVYLVREYIDGKTLDQYIIDKGQIDEQEGIQLGIALCRIVEFFHQLPQPIIIRDIKPNNIIISHDGTLKLIDFSIAKQYEASSIRDTEYLGTRGFAAIEQFGLTEHAKSDIQTDVFGIGATLYYLFLQQDLGKPPYRFESLTQCRPDLSDALESILKKACQLRKEDRYSNVSVFREALMTKINVEKQSSLLEKIQDGSANVILVQGIKAGCGVTHLCYGIAHYLRSIGTDVCIVDFSQQQCLKSLEYQQNAVSKQDILIYEDIPIFSKDEEKNKEQQTSYQQTLRTSRLETSDKIQTRFLKEASFILIDGGTYDNEDKTNQALVALTSAQRIMVSGTSPWEIGRLEDFILEECHQTIDYAINFSTKAHISELQQSIHDKRFIQLPYLPFEEIRLNVSAYNNIIPLHLMEKIGHMKKEEKRWSVRNDIFSRTKKSKTNFQNSIK